jgi:hypothetical protein
MSGSQFIGWERDASTQTVISFLRIGIELKEIERIHSRAQQVDLITFKILVNGEEHGQECITASSLTEKMQVDGILIRTLAELMKCP